MRIRDKIDKKKVSHYLFNDEEIVCMNKKYFNNNYINKDKIREKIKELSWYRDYINYRFVYSDYDKEINKVKIELLKELLEED